MNRTKHSPVCAWFTSVALMAFLCAGTLLIGNVHAQSEHGPAQRERVDEENDATAFASLGATQADKLSPDLRDQINDSSAPRDFSTQGVITIGIAILDSGIYNQHLAFINSGNGSTRIVANVDFTGEGNTSSDPFGHGTHVAGLIGCNGTGTGVPSAYEGIAPNANLINLRVLNSQGV